MVVAASLSTAGVAEHRSGIAGVAVEAVQYDEVSGRSRLRTELITSSNECRRSEDSENISGRLRSSAAAYGNLHTNSCPVRRHRVALAPAGALVLLQ